MIAHRFRFVKNFFQVFSNFFVLSFAAQLELSRAGLAADSIRLPHSAPFVNTFFKFSKLFSGVSLETVLAQRFRIRSRAPVAQRLLILAKHPAFVNTFFHLFRPFSPHLFPQLYLLLFLFIRYQIWGFHTQSTPQGHISSENPLAEPHQLW